ncbi:ribonuclease H-like domain-containing protein [Fusarium venenatum]|uniref:ribonuclease H-like domain-containing protein n=1 Tax=Fusarium venenatum TaxID=56646 RepID=UPI001D8731C6|nr:ribonuclease H-like domain-containing protein [Fusarium venenatum]
MKYYAVAVGSQPGIYNTWGETSRRIQGVSGAKHKMFDTLGEAEDYIRQFGAPETCQSLGIAPGPGQQARQSQQEPRQTPAEQTWEPRSTAYEPQQKQYQSAAEARPAARQFQQTQYASAAEQQDTIRIYTDGSSLGNGQAGSRAGLGVFFGHDDERNHAERLPGLPQTNQRAELLAILRAMEIAPLTQGIEIWTDSQYSINCVQVWSVNWERNNWMTSQKKPVANKDIVRDIRAKMRERQAAGAVTKFQWVKGHASDPGNHEADRLANIGSRMPEVA